MSSWALRYLYASSADLSIVQVIHDVMFWSQHIADIEWYCKVRFAKTSDLCQFPVHGQPILHESVCKHNANITDLRGMVTFVELLMFTLFTCCLHCFDRHRCLTHLLLLDTTGPFWKLTSSASWTNVSFVNYVRHSKMCRLCCTICKFCWKYCLLCNV